MTGLQVAMEMTGSLAKKDSIALTEDLAPTWSFRTRLSLIQTACLGLAIVRA